MKEIELMVGLPRSGKSTYAMNQGVPVVNPDSVRLALHGQPYIAEAEGMVWAVVFLMAKAFRKLMANESDAVADKKLGGRENVKTYCKNNHG